MLNKEEINDLERGMNLMHDKIKGLEKENARLRMELESYRKPKENKGRSYSYDCDYAGR